MRVILFIVCLLAATTSCIAAETCSPNDAATRVLASPNPNDIAPDWTGESYIGTGWSLELDERTTDDSTGLTYIHGVLLSPRGGEQGAAYGLEREWTCFSD